MKTVPFRRHLFAGGFLLALVPVLLFAAPPERAKVRLEPEAVNPADKVRSILDQTVPDQFKPEGVVTLKDALDLMTEQMKLKFEIDDKAFASEGQPNVLATDYSKTVLPEMKNARVKDILRRLLKQIALSPSEATYVVVEGKVFITTTHSAPYRWIEQRVNLDCDNEELSAALKRLASATGTNLAIDARAKEEAKTVVSMKLQDVTLETAVVLLAETSGLRPVRVGNVLFLTTKENAKAMCFPPIEIDPTTGLPVNGSPPLAGPVPLPDEFQQPPGGAAVQIME